MEEAINEHRPSDHPRPHRRQPGLLPGPPGEERPRGNDRASLERAGIKVVALGPGGDQVRRRRDARRGARVRGAVQRAPRRRSTASSSRCRTSATSAAIADTLRMAELDVPVLIQATPDSAGQDDHPGPPRQLLRQDVGLQQPEAVRHPVLADDAAHRGARLAELSRRTSTWFAGVCRVVQRTAARCASAPSARGRRRSTRSATARRCSRRRGISVETDRPVRDPRPHRPAEGRRRRRCRRSSARSSAYVPTRRHARRRAA